MDDRHWHGVCCDVNVAPGQGCAVSQSCLISFLKFLRIGKVAYAHRLLHWGVATMSKSGEAVIGWLELVAIMTAAGVQLSVAVMWWQTLS